MFWLLAGWTLTAAPAGARSDLESSTPATDSVVAEMVDEIEFVFVSSVQPESAEVAVTVDGEPVVAASAAGSSERALLVRPDEPILTAEVGVAVALLAADGHRIEAASASPSTLPSSGAPDRGSTRRSVIVDEHQHDDHHDHNGRGRWRSR